jgi:Terminase small subunit
LLKNVKVFAEIVEKTKERTARLEITADNVLQEIAKLAFFDPRKLFKPDGSLKQLTELDDDTAAGLGGLEVQELFEGTGEQKHYYGLVKKFKITGKGQNLERLARTLGMFDERHIDLPADWDSGASSWIASAQTDSAFLAERVSECQQNAIAYIDNAEQAVMIPTEMRHRPNAHATISGNSSRQNAPPCDPVRSFMTTSASTSRSATAHLLAFSRKNGSCVPATRYVRGSGLDMVPGGL